MISYSTSIGDNIVSVTRSMIMVPIGSPMVVSYLTPIVPNIVSFTVFVIFHAEVLWPRSRTVQDYPRSKVMVPIDSPWWFLIRLLLTPLLYLSSLKKYLTCNFADLEIGQFKVIQSQWSWCQLEAHWWFPIWPPLCPTLYLSRRSRYLMWKLCDIDLGLFKVIQGQRW